MKKRKRNGKRWKEKKRMKNEIGKKLIYSECVKVSSRK